MKPCVLIPAYNVEFTIGYIVSEIKNAGLDVLVVDDGSTDDTERIASEKGALVMRHARNIGKGASLKKGFNFILRMTSFDVIIIMDGDGQHNPKDIKKFLEYFEKHSSDIIVGNRMTATKNMPLVRLLTNKFLSGILSAMCRQRIPDTQCGFRLIKRGVLKTLDLESRKYDLESELLIKASRLNLKVASVPVETIYRDELSRIHPVKDTLRFIGLLLKTYFR